MFLWVSGNKGFLFIGGYDITPTKIMCVKLDVNFCVQKILDVKF